MMASTPCHALTKCQAQLHRPNPGLPTEPPNKPTRERAHGVLRDLRPPHNEGRNLATRILPNFHSYNTQQQTPMHSADNYLG